MSTIKVDQLADEVMKQLNDFADATCDDMKAAVKKAGNTVRDQIKSTAPNRTGAYAKSWSVKNTKESSHAFEVTIYSRNQPLPAGAPLGIRPCQARRRSRLRTCPHRPG